MGMRLTMCKYTVEGTLPEPIHRRGGQLWSLRQHLALQKSPKPELVAGASTSIVCVKGYSEGFKQLGSVNADTSKTKASEICMGSVTDVLAIGSFFSGEATEPVYRIGH